MTISAKGQEEYVPVFEKEKFDSLNKKYFGLNDKDLEEISVFINDFNDSVNSIQGKTDYDGVKQIVDVGNKIPAHCGYIVCGYYVNSNGDEKFIEMLSQLYAIYKAQYDNDPESTKTTDLYEMLACLIQFAPSRTIRKFITSNFEMSKEIYISMRKRPSTNATMSARYSELFVTSNFDSKYSNLIYENYKAMIEFLETKNNEIESVEDAVDVNFNQLRDIMKDFYERGKKESLKSINRLINKKADIGEAFFYWIALNPSCAAEVILGNDSFTGDFIKKFFSQLRIQYIVELAVILENLPSDKLTFMDYIKSTYKLDNVDGCYERLSNFARKDSLQAYGVLLRQISFYPNIFPDSIDNAFSDVLEKLQKKLSSVANNLTASISEKSMSITIVPLGRSRTYQDIMDKIEGTDKNGGGFAAKLRDKDIIKRIRESGLSWFTMDQKTGEVMINIMEALRDVYAANPGITKDEVVKVAYKDLVLKYGIIVSMPYFKYVIDELEGKIINISSDANEDYEEI